MHTLVQESENIQDDDKKRVTPSVCYVYSKNLFTPLFDGFASGEINLSFNEENAIEIARLVSDMSLDEYKQMIKEIEKVIPKSDEPNA